MSLWDEDDKPGCCDTYCTSMQICCLRVMRPGDSVPFQQNNKILPLAVAQVGCGVIVIILDLLAIFCQFKELTSPAPSFLGLPGLPLWISLCIAICGVCAICGYKRKERFMSAISFGCSTLAMIFAISLLGVLTLSIAQEVEYFQEENEVMGVVISSIMMTFVVAEVVIASSNALLEYLALSSHDDRWFTDRGTQHLEEEIVSPSSLPASLSVPSGQPAFLFYAPQKDSVTISNTLENVLSGTGLPTERGTSPMVKL